MLASIGFVDDPTGVENEAASIPLEFKILGNYPNPFNPSTNIKFSLPENMNVNVSVYDILGGKVSEVIDSEMNKGVQEVEWNGKNAGGMNVGSGVYFYRIKAGEKQLTGKMLLQK